MEEDDGYEDEDDDWDEAMLQRELALAVYETQGILREVRASATVPNAPIRSTDQGSWEQQVRIQCSCVSLYRTDLDRIFS